MTGHQASYQHRGKFLIEKVTSYVESRDEVVCKDHGPSSYDLLFMGSGWRKVCHRCFSMVIPDAKEALELTKSGPFVCEAPTCFNDAEKNSYCAWCKGSFCKACMYDKFLCIACNEELDKEEVKDDPRRAFHAC